MLGRVVILVGLSVLVFACPLPTRFVWDDHELVETNPAVEPVGLSGLAGLFAARYAASPVLTPSAAYYRPATILSLAIDRRVWGERAWGFHLTNLLLHDATAIALGTLFVELGLAAPWAWGGACVFLLHPAHVEPVLWISGRGDLLAGLWCAVAWLLYLRARRSTSRAGWLGIGALASFGIAIFSKEIALTLPVILAVHAALQAKDFGAQSRRVLGLLLGSLLVVASYFLLRDRAVGSHPFVQQATAPSWTTRALTAPVLLLEAVKLLFYPVHLAPVRRIAPVQSAWELRFLLAMLVLAVGVALSLWFRSKARWIPQSFALFALGMTPVLGFVPLAVPFAERYLYWPSVAFAWAAAATASRLGAERTAGRVLGGPGARRSGAGHAAIVGLCVLIAGYGVRSRLQAPIWRDDVALFQAVLAEDPGSTLALNELGIALAEQGRWLEARQVLSRAVRSGPTFALAHYNLGKVLEQLGDVDGAIQEFGTALHHEPAIRGLPTHLGTLARTADRRETIKSILEQASRRGSSEARRALEDMTAAVPSP